MLRVGLTGDLGSGKSTVAAMLAARGAVVLSSDEIGRALMQPGEAVYNEIVAHFGSEVVAADGTLDRRRLAQMAFDTVAPRVAELNVIVHPAVIAEQVRQVEAFAQTDTIVVVESALVFSTASSSPKDRFDRILLVTAPEAAKVARFVARSAAGRTLSDEERTALEADAHRRLALQQTEAHAAECLVIRNEGGLDELETQVASAWAALARLR